MSREKTLPGGHFSLYLAGQDMFTNFQIESELIWSFFHVSGGNVKGPSGQIRSAENGIPLDVRSQDSLSVGFSFFRFDLDFPKKVQSLKSAKVLHCPDSQQNQ